MPARNAPPTAEMLWLLAQAGVVAAYAAGVRPSAGYPLPVADSADVGLAVVQMALAALLGPDLLATPGAWLRATASAGAFLTLATMMAGRAVGPAASIVVVVAAWLGGLAVLTRRPPGRLAAAGLTVGLPVLWYVRIEYAGRPATLGGWPVWLGPTLGVCATGLHGVVWPALATPIGLLTAAAALRFGPKTGRRLRSLLMQ